MGFGTCERIWGGVKNIKTGKRSHLGGESIKKRSVSYTTAKNHDTKIIRNTMENVDAEDPNSMLGYDDIK